MTERSCAISVIQWATNEENQDSEKYGQLWKLSGQGEQHCSEPSVICLGDSEDSQRGESTIIKTCKNKGRDKIQCGICGQKMTDGTNVTTFKVS